MLSPTSYVIGVLGCTLFLLGGCQRAPLQPVTDMPASPVEAAPEFVFETYRYDTSKLVPGAVVEVDNPWGDIRLRQHHESYVRVDAAVQRIGANPPAPVFDPDERVDHFRFSVAVPAGILEPRNNRVDLAVFVPAGLSVKLSTADGKIDVKKTANTIDATSDSGRIVITNQGDVNARSRLGAVQAQPMYPGWGEMQLQSQAAGAIAFIPDHNDMAVEIHGASEVQSEYQLDSKSSGWLRLQRGKASDKLVIRSTGPVQIYKTLVDRRPELSRAEGASVDHHME